MTKGVAVLVVLVAVAVAIGAIVFGPHSPSEYLPDIVAALLELTVGGALVAWFLSWQRERRLGPQRTAGLVVVEHALARLIDLLQATYVEATPERPQHLPVRIEQLLPRWREALPRLDLRTPSSVNALERPWAEHIARELIAVRGLLQRSLSRHAEGLGQDFANAVALFEADPYLEFLSRLPYFAKPVQPPDGELGITQLYGFFPTAGVPDMLEEFCNTTHQLFTIFFRLADRPVVPDEVYWSEMIAPFWGRSTLSSP